MLNIITACIRPKNLPKIHESLLASVVNYGKPIDIQWHIVLEGRYKDQDLEDLIFLQKLPFETKVPTFLHTNDSYKTSWESPINIGLSKITEGLVCIVDDDNIMHPHFIKCIYPRYLAGNKGFIFHQQLSRDKNLNNRVRFAKMANVAPGKIDTAQFCFDRSIINAKWIWHLKTPDAVFISAIFQKHTNFIQFVDEILCYYNYLSTSKNRFD
jgi:hypothetical protein